MNPDKTLLLTVGLPRSGKSTWAAVQTYPIVNPDAIRLAVHGQRFYAPAEPLVWSIADVMVKSLFGAGHRVVIVDATNTTIERRRRWQNPAWLCHYKVIPTPRGTCIERARAAGDEDLVPVIERMANGYEALTIDELGRLWSERTGP